MSRAARLKDLVRYWLERRDTPFFDVPAELAAKLNALAKETLAEEPPAPEEGQPR